MMKNKSPHQLLSHISEHRRDVEAEALKELSTYRSTLTNIIEQSSAQLVVLKQQRDFKTEHGAQAMELLMLEQSLGEHQQHIYEVSCEIAALDLAIVEQKKKWATEHKKYKSHEKLYEQFKQKAEKNMHHKTQMMQDDNFAAAMVRKRQVSS